MCLWPFSTDSGELHKSCMLLVITADVQWQNIPSLGAVGVGLLSLKGNKPPALYVNIWGPHSIVAFSHYIWQWEVVDLAEFTSQNVLIHQTFGSWLLPSSVMLWFTEWVLVWEWKLMMCGVIHWPGWQSDRWWMKLNIIIIKLVQRGFSWTVM